jgi:hypothetical protein
MTAPLQWNPVPARAPLLTLALVSLALALVTRRPEFAARRPRPAAALPGGRGGVAPG